MPRRATEEIGVQTRQPSEEAVYIEMAPVVGAINTRRDCQYSPTDSVSTYSGVQMASSFGSPPPSASSANLSIAALNVAVANANMAVAEANLVAVAGFDDEEIDDNVPPREYLFFFPKIAFRRKKRILLIYILCIHF